MNLRADHIVKRYKRRTVVAGVSVEVRQGEIVGLLGPNGAGKTTSFYMITGLVKPNEGRVYLDNTDITDLPMYKRASWASATCRRRPACSASSAWRTTSAPSWR
jgi:lipopolysaccharide export system ATP-binding protein